MIPAGPLLRCAQLPALSLALLLSVLLFSQSFLSCFPMPKIAAIAVLTGFAAAAALATAGWDFLLRTVRRPFTPPLAALIAWMAIGLARSRTPESFSLVFLPAAASAVAAFLAAEMSGESGKRRRLLSAFVLAHGACGAYAVLQHLGLDPLTWTVNYGPGRAFSTIGNPDFLGGQMALAVPVLAALAFAKAGASSFAFVALLFAVLGLVFAQTRSALIGVIAGSVVAAAFLFRTRRVPAIGRWRQRQAAPAPLAMLADRQSRQRLWRQLSWRCLPPARVGALVLVTAILVMYSFPRLNPAGISLPAQLASSLDLEQRSARQRFFWWSGAVHVFLAAPVAGHGTGDFARVFPAHARLSAPPYYDLPPAFCDHPHNDYLFVLGEHGVVGLGLLLWLGAVWLRVLARERSTFSVGVLAGVVATAVHAIWNMPLVIQATIYPAGILLGLTCAGTDRREPGAGAADGVDAGGEPGSRRGKSVNGFTVASFAGAGSERSSLSAKADKGFGAVADDFGASVIGFGALIVALAVAWRPAVLLTAQAYLNGARVLDDNRQYAPGAYLARQTLRLTDAPWRTHFLLGGILYGQQYYSAALDEFSRDENENPWGGDAILHRGKTLRQMGKPDSAEAECRRALALIPNYADAAATLASLAWYRASEARKAGRRGEAATQLRRARIWIAYALGFFPDNAEALRLLGYIELKGGRFELAASAWERYVRAKPADRAMKDRLVALLTEIEQRKHGGPGW